MFIDRATIQVNAGKGGNGCASFYHNRLTGRKQPDGGSGGNGGSIIVRVDENILTLLDLQYKKHFSAKRGRNGSGNNKRGRDGDDYTIKVPPGTIIRDKETGFILRDLIEPQEQVVVAKGGRGGRGNSRFRPALPGEAGEEKVLTFELKLVADVGIIGQPNAGKSTLLTSISKARPRIAGFPFTTTSPCLGVVNYPGLTGFVAVEVPGLIKGAHQGKGLGLEFLRHIERTKILVHLVDMAAVEGRNPDEDYKRVNEELQLYSRDLTKRTQILAANKMDLAEARENLRHFKAKVKKKVYPISAATGEGLNALIYAISEKLHGDKKNSS